MGTGACVWGWVAGNSISSSLGLSWFGSEPEMHPFCLYFNQQHYSFRHLALTPRPSSPTKAINCQAWLIPPLPCPSLCSPSVRLQPPLDPLIISSYPGPDPPTSPPGLQSSLNSVAPSHLPPGTPCWSCYCPIWKMTAFSLPPSYVSHHLESSTGPCI